MKTKQTSIPKITRPRIHNAVKRERLFARIDKNRKHNLITWLSGPAGSGKTTLITSYLETNKLPCLWYKIDSRDENIETFFYYLRMAGKKAATRKSGALQVFTPEYSMGIQAFTLRFFEELYSRLSPPYNLVFDNYQDVPEKSLLHQLICDGISCVPSDISIIIISRRDPPQVYTRLRANTALYLIGWDKLSFTHGETKSLVLSRQKWNVPDHTIKELYKCTKGWVAGLILILEKFRSNNRDIHQQFNIDNPQEIFNYFASETFHYLEISIQRFLLQTACLPRITPSLSDKLTGIYTSKDILEFLCHHNIFTVRLSQRGAVYQYHPLFRDFLLSLWEESFSLDETVQIKKKAAGLLIEEVLVHRQPWHLEFPDWLKSAHSIAENTASHSNNRIQILLYYYLSYYYLTFAGDYRKGKHVIDIMHDMVKTMKSPDLAESNVRLLDILYAQLTANHDLAKSSILKGVAFAHKTGIYAHYFLILGIGAWCMLDAGDIDEAKELLAKIKIMRGSVPKWQGALYCFLSARLHLIKGKPENAYYYSKSAIVFDSEEESTQHAYAIGLIQHAYILHTLKRYPEAKIYLKKYKQFTKRIDSPLLDFTFYAIESYMLLNTKRSAQGQRILRKCLSIGRECQYYTSFIWLPSVMSNICETALANNIEEEYVKDLIKRRRLLPERVTVCSDKCPLPIRIYTMGRFAILKDDKPLIFSGKTPKKPIEMLKAFISLGAREVSEVQITDALWYEADGYLAHKAFSTTLYRLRRLLGYNEAIQLQDGKLSLDNSYCWVDIWEFEHFIRIGEKKLKTENHKEAVLALERAIDIYQGHFLAKDEIPWVITMREQLREMFIKGINLLSRYYKKAKNIEKVIDCYQKGLKIDPTAEELYRDLMIFYHNIGSLEEMHRVYTRCRRILLSTLDTEPSFTVKDILSRISRIDS